MLQAQRDNRAAYGYCCGLSGGIRKDPEEPSKPA